jgi:hypothetical protein
MSGIQMGRALKLKKAQEDLNTASDEDKADMIAIFL